MKPPLVMEELVLIKNNVVRLSFMLLLVKCYDSKMVLKQKHIPKAVGIQTRILLESVCNLRAPYDR